MVHRAWSDNSNMLLYKAVPVTPISVLLIEGLESAPATAELCRLLEQMVLEIMWVSSKQMSILHLIVFRLCVGMESTAEGESADHPKKKKLFTYFFL